MKYYVLWGFFAFIVINLWGCAGDKTYKLTFDTNGGSVISDFTEEPGVKIKKTGNSYQRRVSVYWLV